MSNIKYCVCAIIDLQGFSQHLELGAHDIRTSIGEEAINRLENLADALDIIEEERKLNPLFYPEELFITRINDALIFNLDLHSDLMPDIGKQIKKGYSVSDIEDKFDVNRYRSGEEFEEAVNKRYREATVDLQKFVGLVARTHLHLNDKENDSYFPGVKTVISLGQRKPFIKDGKDDPISANFAFSNAFLAEKNMHGSNFFIDNNVLKLLSVTIPIKNLARLAVHKEIEEDQITLFEKKDEKKLEIPEPIHLKLFRKSFKFREIRPNFLAVLQLIEPLNVFSSENESEAHKIFKKTFDFLTDFELDYDPKQKGDFPIYQHSLKPGIKIEYELLTCKNSKTLEEKNLTAWIGSENSIIGVPKIDISNSY